LKRCLGFVLFALFAVDVSAYVPEWVRKSTVSLGLIDEIRVGDLNGDGRPDLVARTHSNRIYIILTNEDGTLAAPGTAGSGTEVALADLNGDGKLDLVIADSTTKRLIAALGNGHGGFGASVTTTLSVVPSEIEVGDFNGDGRAEVLVRTTSAPAFAVFAAGGNLQFSLISTVPLSPSVLKMLVGDLDGDGNPDVLVAYSSPAALNIHYGHGDRTFEPGVPVAGPASAIDDVTVGDLDADGHPDIVTCGSLANTVTVIRNMGDRKFAVPVSYDVHMYNNETYPYALLLFDATDDGKPDVVAVSGSYTGVMTLAGNGDGTLLPPVLDRAFDNQLFPFVAADLTGDGKLDLIVGEGEDVVLMRTAPGELIVSVLPTYSVATPAVDESYTVWVRSVLGGVDGVLTPFPTGTVTVMRDGAPIGSAALTRGVANINDTSLSLGSYQITASFPGDASYRATVSTPANLNVLAPTTVVTLANNHDGQTVPYGTEYVLTAQVSSPIAGNLTGSVTLYVDGQRSQDAIFESSEYVMWPTPAPGTHTFYAVYNSDATHPPGKSNTLNQVVVKGDVAVGFDDSERSVNFGDQARVWLHLFGKEGSQGNAPSGNVYIYDGGDLLLTVSFKYGDAVPLTLPVLPAGVHYLYMKYNGDDLYNPALSQPLKYTVIAPPPLPPKRRAVHH
jgi:hypothetical protein